ncbi:YolD-like family protein [Paenibacillus sediminis]|uniref:YolD-like family protein n=1 Tax=Paenibacillus sediminis TaxID=664909 RepID=A0ABS4GZY2_9BACL|nr:YolD-like family protein [Paenibacillus sediminis]MBP1935587.1 hypothetical protein [Paenibacillus sediminis]
MTKKLQGNGLFESSRMMLPEHREAYLQHQQRIERRIRPELDSQVIEHIERILSQSLDGGARITLTLWNESEDKKLSGKVIQFDSIRGRIRFESVISRTWIPFNQIIGASAEDES